MPTISNFVPAALATLAAVALILPAGAGTSHHRVEAGRSAYVGGGPARLGARGAGPVDNDTAPGPGPARTTAAPGGEDGGAGGYGQVGNPYSQAGYGAGAFGDGRPLR